MSQAIVNNFVGYCVPLGLQAGLAADTFMNVQLYIGQCPYIESGE